MPTLEDAFPTVCEALVEHFGVSPGRDRAARPVRGDHRACCSTASSVGTRRQRRSRRSRKPACSPRNDWRSADVLEIRDALLEKAVSASPLLIAPLQAPRRVDRRASRRPGRIAVQSRSIDGLAARRAGCDPRHRPGGCRRDPALRPQAAVLSGRPGDVSGSGPPRLARPDCRCTTKPATCWSTRPRRRAMVPDGEAANRLIDLAQGMEQLGRRYCRAAAPRCDQCPLESALARGRPARSRWINPGAARLGSARAVERRLSARRPEARADVRSHPAQEARLLRQGPGSARGPLRRASDPGGAVHPEVDQAAAAGSRATLTRKRGSRRCARRRAGIRSTRWTVATSRRRGRSTSGCW